MSFNSIYINIEYALIEAFMMKANVNLLDVSYMVKENIIKIQVVLLEEDIPIEYPRNMFSTSLADYEVEISYIYISKSLFNDNKGEWRPKYYTWLDHLLFSKSEVL